MSGELELNSIMTGNISIAERIAMKRSESITLSALALYDRLTDDVTRDRFTVLLETGVIPVSKDETVNNEELASKILVKVIENTKADAASPMIELEDDTLELVDSYEQTVREAISTYADDLLANSVLLFAQAMNFDPRICDPILRFDSGFYNEIEEMGFPMLALLSKLVLDNRENR